MYFFITGGAGFIGSNLVNRLLARESTRGVVVYDNLKSGSLDFIEKFLHDSRVRFVLGDINDFKSLLRAVSGCNVLIHLAANPDISKADTDPALDFREGTVLTQNVLEAARIKNIKRIIFTSGSGVYGEVPGQVFSEEFGPCRPISPYGAAKLGSEALISAYCHMFGLQGVALRFANVVGPNQTHGVGFDFVNRLKKNSSHLKILGDGSQCKSYIYVSDVLDAVELTLETKKWMERFEIFNVATNDYVTVTEIATFACEVLGIDPDKVEFQYTGGDRGWNGDVPKVLFDSSKLRKLGWANRFSSQEAILKSLTDLSR